MTAIAKNTDLPIYEAGIIPQSSESFAWCTARGFYDGAKCSSYLNKEKLETQIKTSCEG